MPALVDNVKNVAEFTVGLASWYWKHYQKQYIYIVEVEAYSFVVGIVIQNISCGIPLYTLDVLS